MTGQTAVLPARRPDWGELSAAMKALNEQQQEFVYLYVSAPPRRGSLVEAYRQAGYGEGSTPANQAKGAWRLAHDERVLAAIHEETRKIIRAAYPEAVNAWINLLRSPDHRDHGRAVSEGLSRALPVETKHNIEVVHTTKDSDMEAVEELRAARELGATREKLIELFGGNGLDRIEALEAADANRRAQAAKVIEAEVIANHPKVATSDEQAFDPEDF
jgi:phage terminase small subunit